MNGIDWDALPRLLNEQCEGGCGRFRDEVYRQAYPTGAVLWECRSCYVRNWREASGNNDQPAGGEQARDEAP